MDTIRDALDSTELREGVRTAIPLGILLLVVAVAWLLARRGRPEPLPFAGMAFAAASYLALDDLTVVPDEVTRAVLLAAAGGAAAWLLSLVHPQLVLLGAVAAIPAALELRQAVALEIQPDWVRLLLIALVVLGATLLADFDQHHRATGWGPGFFAVTIAGVWSTVPDTEHVLVLLGVALVVLAASVLFPLVALGAIGIYPSIVIVAWVVAIDGRGRLSSMIGAAGCLGLPLIEPVARRLSPRRVTIIDRWATYWWGVFPALFSQGVLIFVAARVAGMQDKPGNALVTVAVLLGIGLVGLLGIPSHRRPIDVPSST